MKRNFNVPDLQAELQTFSSPGDKCSSSIDFDSRNFTRKHTNTYNMKNHNTLMEQKNYFTAAIINFVTSVLWLTKEINLNGAFFKRTLRPAYIAPVFFFFMLNVGSSSAQLLTEDFSYSGALSSNGWTVHSGTTNSISTTSGLSYTGYQGSGVDNAALIGNAGGEDVNVTFTNQNTDGQDIYFSCMVNVTDAATSKSGDYLMHLGTPGGASFSSFASRVFIKISSSNVIFGISNSTTASYGSTNFAKNTTYLLIVKYTINVSGNDNVSLWVISSGVPATEIAAGTAEVTNTTTAGQNQINTIALRQGSASTSVQTVIDGINVGTTWATGVPASTLTPPTLTAAVGATVDAAFDVTFTDDAAWRAAVTDITVDATSLTAGSSVTSGIITFTPSTSSPVASLQSTGTKSIIVVATGYSDATVSQAIDVGIDNKLTMSVQPTDPATNGAVLATQPVVLIQDQYGNATSSTATVTANTGSGTWTPTGSTTANAGSGTATFSGLSATSAAAVTGATINFTSPGLTAVVSGTFDIPSPSIMAGPSLTAAVGATVDADFDVTFADDAVWRAAVISVSYGATTLTAVTDYSFVAGILTLKPSGNAALQVAGTETVTVVATGYSDATVSQSIGAGADNYLAMDIEPTDPAVNANDLATQPSVFIRDQYGNATSSTATVTATTGAGSWTPGGNTTANGVSGTATFSGLNASSAAAVTGATIIFTSTGLTSVTSAAFDIPAPILPADHIVFVSVPSTGITGHNVSSFQVHALRSDNSVDNTYIGSVTITVATGSGNLTGTTTKTCFAGVATFNDLQFDAADSYTVDANSGSFSQITSGTILIRAAIASWDFEAVTTNNINDVSPMVSVGSAVADAGLQTTGSLFSALHASSATDWSNPSGNGSTQSLSSNNWAIGDYYEFLVDLSNFQDIFLNFDQMGSGSGPADFKIQYSTDGVSYSDFVGNGYSLGNTSWHSYEFDLSSITALNGLSTAYFRMVDTSTVSNSGGTVGTGGTSRVDNVVLSGNTAACSAPSAPTGTASQSFCGAPTIADLSATGTGIIWYDMASGGTAYISTDLLVNGNHYYATQTVASCESTSRLDVTATVTPYVVTNTTTTTSYCTIQSAIDAAATGNNLQLLSNVAEGLVTVNKAITIDGDGFTLNSSSSYWGIHVSIAGVTITDLNVSGAGTFGIIASCGADNLVLTNVTVTSCGGSGISLAGSDNCVLTNITSTNNTGNGISITNCDNTTINGLTTSGNSFSVFGSGIGLFTSSTTCPPAGINGLSLIGTISIAENPKVYSQKENAADVITGLSGSSIMWAVGTSAVDRSYWPDKATSYFVVKSLFEAPYNFPNTTVFVEEVATDNLYVDDNPAGDAVPPMLIQTAINFAAAGKTVFAEVGTYLEAVNLNKVLTLSGAGSTAGGSIITATGGTALSMSAGTNAGTRVIAQNLRLTGSTTGVVANSYNTLDNVASVSNTNYGINLSPLTDLVVTNSQFNSNSQAGLKLSSAASASYLSFTDCEFNSNPTGWYADASSAIEPTFDNVTVTNTTFNDNLNKGIYVERLSNAIFDNITVNNTGTGGAVNHRAGIDLNLKWRMDYTNIQILNSTISNCGTGDPNGNGICIKARSDGGTYGPNPAALDNVVISNCIISGNGGTAAYSSGVRIGEANNSLTGTNTSPTNVSINNCSFSGNSTYSLRNATVSTTVDATCNWWDTTTPATIAASISGSADYTPYLTNGTDGDLITDGFQPSVACSAPCALVVSASATDATCPAQNDGTATVSITSGGVGPYTYLWSNGGTTSSVSGLTAGSYSVTVTDINGCTATGSATVVNSTAGPVHNTISGLNFCTIQAAINDAATVNGHTITIDAGTYVENVVVTKSLNIQGAGQGNTIVIPAISNPNCGGAGGGSICAGGSNVFLIQASNVTIHDLTIDGDNTGLTSGTLAGGADLDARNGIITDHTLGVYQNLEVYNVTVQNIYLRGMYASSGGSFNFHDNTVTNVQAQSASIGMFNFGGSGFYTNNNVSDCNDAIASNWSTGTVYSGNTVSNSASGIHTDNNGGSGGIADTIRNNTVQNSSINGYGIWVFAPFRNVQVLNNTVNNVDVGLTSAGQNAAVTPVFSSNVIDGQNKVNSTGMYITTSLFGFGSSNVSVDLSNNYFVNNAGDGFYLESEAGQTLTLNAHNNSISGNAPYAVEYGVGASGAGTFTVDMTCNWWGTNVSGTIASGHSASTTYIPYLTGGTDSSPATGFQTAEVCSAPCALVLSSSNTSPACPSFNDGTASVSISSGGVGPYTYLWSNGATTATATGLVAGTYTVTVSDANGCTATTSETVSNSLAGPVHNQTTGLDYCTIQLAIDAVATTNGDVITIDAGTYNENVSLNKGVTLQGSGPATTILTPAVACSGSGVTISAANAKLKDLTVTNYNYGIAVSSTGNEINNVYADANCTAGLELSSGTTTLSVLNSHLNNNTSLGFRKGTAAIVSGFTMDNCQVTGNLQGCFIAKNNGAGGTFDNVSISNSDFSNNLIKGMYFEALSNATLDNITMNNSGTDATYGFNTGIDINLKYGAYTNIVIENSSIINCGSNGTATDVNNPSAIAVKARDDSPSYSSNPASLNGFTLRNTFVSGPVNGLRFGEFNKVNTTPTGITVTDNHFGNGYSNKAILNTTSNTGISVSCNWYGTTSAAAVAALHSNIASYTPYLTGGVDGSGSAGFQPASVCSSPCAMTVSTSSTDVTCPSTNNGTASVSVTGGGVGPYTYLWSNSETTASISGLTAGTYTVTVTDDNGCTATGTATVSSLPVTNTTSSTSYSTIQAAINAATAGDAIEVCAGTYDEDVNINKTLSIIGAGAGSTTIRGIFGGDNATVRIAANNIEVAGFTITRLGNNITDWNLATLNSTGVGIQGAYSGTLIRDNNIVGNRTGIDVNNSSGHTFRNNTINDNRTGLLFRNQTDNMTVIENEIKDNWTVGVLFLDASSGSNSPLQTALNCDFSSNDISGNWYGQIVDRQTGGSLPAPGANLKSFTCNWLGTTSPVVSIANSTEPGYSAQIPVAYGGSAVAPGGQPDILGTASANIVYIPMLTAGTDANVETTPGRGTYGFQPAAACSAPCALVVSASSTDATCPSQNDGTASVSITSGGVGPYSYLWSNGATTATATGLVAGSYSVTVTDFNGCTATANATVVNSSAGPVHNTNSGFNFCTIQAAINDAATANGHTITIDAGTYVENVVVTKSLNIQGAGQGNTIVIPAISNPNCGGAGGGSICAGGSNVFLIQASNVTIHDLTIDGDNTGLTSGTLAGGADLDARNGIITDHTLGVYQNLEVYNVTVQNIYLRGMYASSGGSFNFHDNTVTNVQAQSASIGMFNFGGSGFYTNNNVSDCNDAIASNWSTGTVYSGNTVSNSASGIHTDNNGGSGGIADTIRNNTVQNSSINGYGIWVFAPFRNVQVLNNTVNNVDVGLTSAGQNAAVTPVFSSNVIDGQNKVNSTGMYITTSLFGFGSSNVSVDLSNNYFVNNAGDGFYLESEAGQTLTLNAHNNSISGNAPYAVEYGVGASGAGTFTVDMTCNWWGTNVSGTIASGHSASTTYIPYLTGGTDSSPATGFQTAEVCSAPCALVVSASATDAGCPSYSDGTASVSISSGGVGPYTYLWSNGATTATATGLVAGTYTVTVTDDNGCTATGSATIGASLAGPVHNTTTSLNYCTIQAAINAATTTNGDAITVDAGTYDEDVNINKSLSIIGAGAGSTTIRGIFGGDNATVRIAANNIEVAGFTITRLGNNITDWNLATLNSTGVGIQGAYSGTLIRDNNIVGNRTGIDVNNSSGHTFRNNTINDNRTGLLFRNQTDNMTVIENEIKDNWTVGVLFLDASSGSNSPLQTALNCDFSSNDISGNWYGQIVDRQTGGSLPAPGANLKSFTCNWLGTTSPVVSIANSTEPGYSAQIPVAYGGSAVAPGGQPDILGTASANIVYIPMLTAGTDANVETTPGRGTYGFQPAAACSAPCALVVSTSTTGVSCPSLNDGTATVSVTSGGTGSYTYLWSNGATTATASGLVVGTYTVTVTDLNGCTATGSATVTSGPSVPVHNQTTGLDYCTIQLAIDAVATTNGDVITIDAGTYNENVSLNKGVTLQGSGPATTILTPAVACSGSGVTISAANAKLKDLTVTNYNYGIAVSSTGNEINNVYADANCTAGLELSSGTTTLSVLNSHLNNNTSLGFRKGTAAIVSGFTMDNCQVTGNLQGCFIAKNNGAGGTFDNVSISNSDFSNNLIKGMYFEALSNATLDNITMNNSGTDATYGFNTGIDINLKYGAYTNIVIENSSITNCGSNGTATDVNNPSAIAVKARDDSPSYSSNPASLNGFTLRNTFVSGPVNGLRFGEFNKVNTTPTGITVTDNHFGNGYSNKAILNTTSNTGISVSCNWYGTTSAAAVAALHSNIASYTPYLTGGVDGSGSAGFQPASVCSSPCALILTPANTPPGCPSYNDGTASVTIASGGVGPYTYLWSNGATTATITGLVAGTYSVTVDDVNGCTATASISVANSVTGPVKNLRTGLYYCSIQPAISDPLTINSDTITVASGTYDQDVNITKSIHLLGAGAGTTTIRGVFGGDIATVKISAVNVEVAGFTITRLGNNPSEWNLPNINTMGIRIQSTSISGALIHDNNIEGNYVGVDLNHTSNHTFRNNTINNNHIGMKFRNRTNDLTIIENEIKDNRTVGIVFMDGSSGTNSPVQQAANCNITGNDITGNWYGQVEDLQTGGSLPAPGSSPKSLSCNWFGPAPLVVTTANSNEPAYSVLIPVAYGGTAVAPGSQPDILGAASANIVYGPALTSGVDANVETTPGRGIYGFQPSVSCTPPCMMTISMSSVDPSCYAVNDGKAYVTVTSGGVAPYYYTWSSGSTVDSATGLVAGNYTVTVSDLNSCTASGSVTLTDPAFIGSSFPVTACETTTLPWSQVVTTSGNYNYTYTAANGCDSVVTAMVTINYNSSSSQSITACDSYTWNAVTYTTSGTYTTTGLTTVAGCDSTATVILTINESTSSSTSVTECDSYTWNAVTYTTSGTYTTTGLTNEIGCDSSATVILTIIDSTTSTSTISACDSYTWNAVVYTTSGTYIETGFTNEAGCDSSATLILTINYSSSSSTNVTACDSYTWNAVTHTTSGTYTTTGLTTVAGCDSSATVVLTINYSSSSSTNITACDTYTWNGDAHTTSGSYTTTGLTNAAGCDSSATVVLMINYSSSSSTNVTACDSYTWNAVSHTTSGTYTTTGFTNAAGCDSSASVVLTINYSSSSSTNVTACDSYTWNAVTHTTSGTYTTTGLTNAVGCDSSATVVLTINYSSSSSTNVTACDSYTWNAVTHTTSGTYTTTGLTNATGCDSSATVVLTINYSSSSSTNVTACDSYTWNAVSHTTSGTYTTTGFTNAAGCDSSASVVLTINYSSSSSTNVTACDSYTWNAVTHTTFGTYTTTGFTNAAGCDSSATVVLTINYSSSSSTNVTACDSYTWNAVSHTTSGTYTTTGLTNATGCDSSATVVLTINYSSSSSTNVTACDSYTWNAVSHTTSGIYTTTGFTNAAGCDSSATVVLTINYSSSSSTNVTACDSYTWNAVSHTTSGIYTTTGFTNAAGCDSSATVVLTINYSSSSSTNVTACGSYTWNAVSHTTSGTYTTIGLTNAAGCDSSATVVLTITNLNVTATPAGSIVCFGGAVNVNVTASGGLAPYAGIGTYLQGDGITVYTVTDDNGCSGTASVTLVQPAKVEGTTTTTPANCGNPVGTATVTASGGNGVYTYLWSDNQTTQTAIGLAVGSYTVTITDGNGCYGTASATVVGVGVLPDPAGAIVGPAGACRNTCSVVYTIPPVSGATSYIWALPAGASGSSSSNSITLCFDNSYNGGFLCVTPSNTCGTSAQSCMNIPVITVRPAQPGFIIGDMNPCGNTTHTYSIPLSANALSYNWSVTGSGVTIMTGQGTNSVTVSFPNGFGQAVIGVYASNCIGTTSTRSTTLTGIPSHSSALFGPGFVCANTNNVAYNISAIIGAGSSYFWSSNSTEMTVVGLQGSNSTTVNFGPSFTSGLLSVTTSSACGSYTKSYTIQSTPAQPGSITGPGKSLCGLTNVTYSISAVNGATGGYFWTVPVGVNIIGSNTGQSITVNFTGAFTGSGNICVSALNACGSSTVRCYAVTARPAGPDNIVGPYSVCKTTANAGPYSVNFDPNATAGYIWSITGGAVIAPPSSTNTATVDFTLSTANSATLTVNALNACGASTPTRITIAVNLSCRLTNSPDASIAFNASPNPTSGFLNVRFEAEKSADYILKVTDLLGNVIVNHLIAASDGINMKEVDLSRFAKGMYLLSIESEGLNKQTLRIVVE